MSTNARSLGNKQEELALCAHSEGYDIIGVTETWWDNSNDWGITMGSYRLFVKTDRVEEVEELHSTLRKTLNISKSTMVFVTALLDASGLKSKGSSPSRTSHWASATQLLTTMTMLMKRYLGH